MTADAIRGLRVEALSPDGSVKAKYSMSEGVRIATRPTSLDRHTDSSLAEQVQQALTSLLSGFRDERSQLRRRTLDPDGDEEPSPIAAERHRRYTAALADITASAQSPNKTVDIGIHATKGFRVSIKPGTLHRFGAPTTMSEIDSTIGTVLSRYRAESSRAYDAAYTDLEPEKLEEELNERANQP